MFTRHAGALMDYITVKGEEVDFLVGTLKFPGNRRISPSFVQIYLNIKFQPAALHLLRRNPAKEQLSRVHQARKNDIVGLPENIKLIVRIQIWLQLLKQRLQIFRIQ